MTDNENSQWIDTRLQSKRMQYVQGYLSNGRKLQNLPSAELRERWAAVVRLSLDCFEAGTRFDSIERENIESELILRKEEPPKPRGAELERMKALGRKMQQRLLEHPELAANFRDIVLEIEQLKQKSKKSNS